MKFDIWKECPKVPLPSVLLTVVDNRGKTVPTAPSGHKLIATNCVRNENLYPVYEKIRYLSEETYRTWFRAHPEPGDIIFVCKGTPGRVCLVPDPIDFCIAQDMVALRADPKIVYNKYLLAVLRSFQIQEQILSTSVGDVIPHFKKSFFDQIMIPIPNMDIQKSIGDFYYTISEKTELNKKINDNFPKKTNNPNPSPIGNKFGLFLFGPSGENRTHGLLNPIQARYQNCATPGYRPPLPYRSVATKNIILRQGRFVNRFFDYFWFFLRKV